MASIVKTKTGKKIVLLNPAEKATRFTHQLRTGCITETREKLNDKQKGYRAGYLSARSDNAKAYNSKNNLVSKAKKRVPKR